MKLYLFCFLTVLTVASFAKSEEYLARKVTPETFNVVTSVIASEWSTCLAGNIFRHATVESFKDLALNMEIERLFTIDPSDKEGMKAIWQHVIDADIASFADTSVRQEIRRFIRALVKVIKLKDIQALFTPGSVVNLFRKAEAVAETTLREHPDKEEFLDMLRVSQECLTSFKDSFKVIQNMPSSSDVKTEL